MLCMNIIKFVDALIGIASKLFAGLMGSTNIMRFQQLDAFYYVYIPEFTACSHTDAAAIHTEIPQCKSLQLQAASRNRLLQCSQAAVCIHK